MHIVEIITFTVAFVASFFLALYMSYKKIEARINNEYGDEACYGVLEKLYCVCFGLSVIMFIFWIGG